MLMDHDALVAFFTEAKRTSNDGAIKHQGEEAHLVPHHHIGRAAIWIAGRTRCLLNCCWLKNCMPANSQVANMNTSMALDSCSG
jgi:hypothetical protein